MELTEKQKQLFEFVKEKHKDQKRKHTNEPYHTHLYNVAEIVSAYESDCIEIALCHDLFEDTNCNFNVLYKAMTDIGYERDFSYNVCSCVTELTDKFTKEEYPYLNRSKRKKNEAERLSKISAISQSVKYADLIDNTSSIAKYDKDFAKVYLKEKEVILSGMNQGNAMLYKDCKQVLGNALLCLTPLTNNN